MAVMSGVKRSPGSPSWAARACSEWAGSAPGPGAPAGCQVLRGKGPQGLSWIHRPPPLTGSCLLQLQLRGGGGGRGALCILKMSHPGCNVNNAEGRPSCWAEAGCLSRLLPYTSVAMTHSFLSSDIKHTDWYIESLGEHIADIRHAGFSLCNRSGTFSPKLLSL